MRRIPVVHVHDGSPCNCTARAVFAHPSCHAFGGLALVGAVPFRTAENYPWSPNTTVNTTQRLGPRDAFLVPEPHRAGEEESKDREAGSRRSRLHVPLARRLALGLLRRSGGLVPSLIAVQGLVHDVRT